MESSASSKFAKELITISKNDSITIADIKKNRLIETMEKIEYEDIVNHLYFYKGGNSSVGGVLGIQGQSPFFLKVSFFSDKRKEEGFFETMIDKINTSRKAYQHIFKGIIENSTSKIIDSYDLDFIENYFDSLEKEENLDIISKLDSDWIFIKNYKEKDTEPLHNKFVFHWFGETRKKSVGYESGICSVCHKYKEKNPEEGTGLIFPRLPFFVLEKAPYNFNFQKDDLKYSKFKICEECAEKAVIGWEILTSSFGNQDFLMIPKLKQHKNHKALEIFHKIISKDTNKFRKLNSLLREKKVYKDFLLNFLVVGKDRGSVKYLEKLVRNFKSFSVDYQGEKLVKENWLEYVDFQAKINIPEINFFFKIEEILKFFFRDESNMYLPKYFHFYKLYHSDDTMKAIPERMDSSFKYRLYKYRDELFSFLYQVNPENLNLKTINDICLNFLLYEIRNQRKFYGEKPSGLDFLIMEGLNYYYFILNKFKGELNLKKNVINLKEYFREFEKNKENIEQLIEDDKSLLFYLIGQFIRKIDNYRYQEKKSTIFNEFIQAVNKRNIEERFANDILIKQNYYIERLNKKAKFIFDILKNYLDEIFKYELYNKMIISIITGYYSNNYLGENEINE